MAGPARPHGHVSKFIHWSTAALMLFGFMQNGDVTNALNDPAKMRTEVLFGLAVGLAFVIRFFWMRHAGPSRLPEDAPQWEHVASTLAHRSIYVAVAALVLSGLGIAMVQNGPPARLELVSDIHTIIANLTALLIGLHVAAAGFHYVIRRDGVLESMLPSWKSVLRQD